MNQLKSCSNIEQLWAKSIFLAPTTIAFHWKIPFSAAFNHRFVFPWSSQITTSRNSKRFSNSIDQGIIILKYKHVQFTFPSIRSTYSNESQSVNLCFERKKPTTSKMWNTIIIIDSSNIIELLTLRMLIRHENHQF